MIPCDHWVQIDGSNVVTKSVVCDSEQFLINTFGGTWIKNPKGEATKYRGLGHSVANIQALIDAAPDGTVEAPTVINLPSGMHRVDLGVKMYGRSHMRVIGPADGSCTVYSDYDTIDLSLDDRIHWDIGTSTNVVVSFVRVEGPNNERNFFDPDYADYQDDHVAEHAFAIRSGCVGCGFEDVTFTQVYGDGCYVGYHNNGVANVDCWVKRMTGTYCGRQCFAVTHVDGFVGEDINIDWGGRSGLDIEPNHSKDKAWDVTITRAFFGSRYYPFTITGADNGLLPQRKNISLIDCGVIRCASAHTAIQATREPCDGTLLIQGHVDTRQSTGRGIDISGEWPNLSIIDCNVTVGRATPTTYGVWAKCSGNLTITGCTFNGAQDGADELVNLAITPASYVHSGNVWANGSGSD